MQYLITGQIVIHTTPSLHRSPIYAVPPEILHPIFSFIIAGNRRQEAQDIGLVCRKWNISVKSNAMNPSLVYEELLKIIRLVNKYAPRRLSFKKEQTIQVIREKNYLCFKLSTEDAAIDMLPPFYRRKPLIDQMISSGPLTGRGGLEEIRLLCKMHLEGRDKDPYLRELIADYEWENNLDAVFHVITSLSHKEERDIQYLDLIHHYLENNRPISARIPLKRITVPYLKDDAHQAFSLHKLKQKKIPEALEFANLIVDKRKQHEVLDKIEIVELSHLIFGDEEDETAPRLGPFPVGRSVEDDFAFFNA